MCPLSISIVVEWHNSLQAKGLYDLLIKKAELYQTYWNGDLAETSQGTNSLDFVPTNFEDVLPGMLPSYQPS